MKSKMKLVLLLLQVICCCAVGETHCASQGEIRCSYQDKCIPLRYLCDKDPDCNDHSDETDDLCRVWQSACNHGETRCSRNGEAANCIPIPVYCSMQDPPCDGDLDLRLCQMLLDGKLQPLDTVILRDFGVKDTNLWKSEQLAEEFRLTLNSTISHPQCPALYTMVDDQCLSVFHPAAVSWGAARAFCAAIGGDLLTLDNVTQYATVIDHLRQARMTADFWVGGRYVNQTQGWTWVDHSPMDLGSPFWAIRHLINCTSRNVTFPETGATRPANDGACYHYQQAPQRKPSGWCVALTYQHYFRMTDEDCLLRKSPLCIYTDTIPDLSDENVTLSF